VEEGIRRYAPGLDITVELVALTKDQIERWNLPTRPTKKSDVRAKKWGRDESVELDAIPPQLLQDSPRALTLAAGCAPSREG
jgi:hypothetical protein